MHRRICVSALRRRLLVAAFATGSAGCAGLLRTTPSPPPVPSANYDYAPASPCQLPGSTKITVAIVAPQWQSATYGSSRTGVLDAQPEIFQPLSAAMQADFLEMASCKGYTTKGPYDSFDAMVFPDREASQLLLEPELQIRVEISSLADQEQGLLGGLLAIRSTESARTGSATVGGRVTLSLREPVTNTRMWAKSIEVPATSFTFTTKKPYGESLSEAEAKVAILKGDEGLRRELQPRLEAMYRTVLTTAERYLDSRELALVAKQAADVRKKATVGVPR